MPNSRDPAHQAMRTLWEVVDKRLREPDVAERKIGSIVVREVETDSGARIRSFGGRLSVSAEFEKPDGTDETLRVEFPDDIRDLSESEVRIGWSNESGSGTNTAPLRDFPKIAGEILVLV